MKKITLANKNTIFDAIDEALEVADATGDTVMLGENNIYRIPVDVREAREAVVVRYPVNDFRYSASKPDFIVHDPFEVCDEYLNLLETSTVGACLGKVLFNGQTLLYEADRLREVAAVRGVVTFDEFAKFHRRLIPLLKELGISIEDNEDNRKARLEAEG